MEVIINSSTNIDELVCGNDNSCWDCSDYCSCDSDSNW